MCVCVRALTTMEHNAGTRQRCQCTRNTSDRKKWRQFTVALVKNSIPFPTWMNSNARRPQAHSIRSDWIVSMCTSIEHAQCAFELIHIQRTLRSTLVCTSAQRRTVSLGAIRKMHKQMRTFASNWLIHTHTHTRGAVCAAAPALHRAASIRRIHRIKMEKLRTQCTRDLSATAWIRNTEYWI